MASKSWFSGSFSGDGSSWFSGAFGGSRASSGMSLNQALSLIEAQERAKKRKSLLGSIWGGGKSGLGFALRQIMRPSHGMAEGVRRSLEGEGFEPTDFFKGFSRGVQLKKRTTFSEVLEQEGVLKGHGRLRGVAGFGLDVVTDPTLPLWIGATVATGGTAAPVLIAARAAAQTSARTGATLAAKKAAYENLESVAKEAGEGFSAHRAMAKIENFRLTKQANGKPLDEVDETMLAGVQEMARQEIADLGKVFQLKVGLPKVGTLALTPAKIGGKRVAPLVPSLKRTALGQGIIAKAPITSKAANQLGRVFRHGFLEEEWQKPLLASAHMQERLFDRYTHVAHDFLSKSGNKLSQDERFAALAWGERQNQLVQGKARILNDTVLNDAVTHGAIKAEQADFIRDWHNFWEYMRGQDHKFGVKYEKELGDKLYVPHIYAEGGGIITKSDLAQAGFTKQRVEDITLDEIKQLQDAAKRSGWLTDPLEIAAVRTRRAAQAHGRESLLSVMRLAHGTPAQVPDVKKIHKLEREWIKANEQFKKWERYYKPFFQGSQKANQVRKFEGVHRREVSAINKKYKKLRATARSQREFQTLLRREQRLLDNADKRLEQRIASIDDWMHEQVAKADKEARRLHSRILRLESAASVPWMRKNPNIPKGWEKLQRRIQGEQYYFKPEIHNMMNRVEHALRSEAEMEKLVSTYQKYMAKWKVGVTSINPGYRVRNSISDLWNMYVAGVPAHAIVRYTDRAIDMQRTAERVERKVASAAARGKSVKLTPKERQALHMLWEAHGHGVLSGLFQGDIALVGKTFMAGGASQAMLKSGRPVAAFARAAQNFNRRWEDRGRLIHYLYRREGQKMTASDAAAEVKKAHFDYTELTPMERDKFRAFLPFYTWTRKNIPYQLVQMISRPGKYATFPKMLQEANYMATGDPRTPMTQEATLPGWLRERYAFRIPFFGNDTVALPVMGVSDLAKLEHPKEFFNMLAPQWRAAYEAATGKSMLTGQTINDGRRRPVSSFGAAIAGVLPGSDIGPTERMVHGERVQSLGAAPWVGYLAGQLPLSNFLVNQTAGIPLARRGGKQTALGYLAGLPTYQRDLEAEMVAAQIEHGETLNTLIRRMRDEGIIPERKIPKETAFQKRLSKILGGG